MKTNSSRAFKETVGARGRGGGISPCLSVCRPGKWGRETRKLELLLAAHSAQSPFSNPHMLAGWTVGRGTVGALQTQTQPGSLIMSGWNLDCGCTTILLMIITITGLGPQLTKIYWMGSNTIANLSAAKLTHTLLFHCIPVHTKTTCSKDSQDVPQYYFPIIFSLDYWGIRPDRRHVTHEIKSKKRLVPKSLKEEWWNSCSMLSVTGITSQQSQEALQSTAAFQSNKMWLLKAAVNRLF